MKQLIFLLLATVFIFSCKKESDSPAPVDFGYNYYPLETGKTNLYQVTEINIDAPSGIYDTTIYLLKTVIDTPYYDNNSKLIYPINRYIKYYDSAQWIIKDVWFAYMNNSHLIVSEENIHFLKLIFPIDSNKIWNGNTYNTMSEQEYGIDGSEYKTPYTLNGIFYDSAITVIENDYETLISKFHRYEKYAVGTGLIELTDINIESVLYVHPDTIIEHRIQRGTIYRQVRVQL